jgi:hypothetical protein
MSSNASPQVMKRLVFGLVLAEIVAVVLPVAVLGHYFQFPDILRAPAGQALALF